MGNQISLPSRRIFVTICASSLLLLPVAQVRATYADIDLSNAASDSQVSTLQGAHSSGSLGTSVSDAGDVNGDGFPDIIVGAPNADTNGRGRAGAVYLLFGRAGGFMNVDLAGFVSSDSTGFIVQGNGQEESDDYYYNGSTTPNTRWRGDNLGISVSGAGDMNNDGFSDIVVGAPNASLNGIVGAGAVYVILGKKEGFSTVDLAGFVSSDSTGFIVQGAVEYFNLGTSVSGAGDVNNDGFSDIVLGAHHASFYGKGTTGAVYVLFGRAGGFSTVDLADFVSSDSTGYMIQGAEAGDNLGISVSGAGDMNNDGFSDVVVGASQASPNLRLRAGAVYVILGKKEGFSTVDLVGFVSSDSTGFIVQGAVEYFNLGTSVSGAGDVNGDGCDDVIIGAPRASPSFKWGVKRSAGVAFVILGKKKGFATVDVARLSSSDSTGYMIQGAEGRDDSEGDNLGTSVSGAGDANGDGLADVIIGASGADPNSRSGAGAVYVLMAPTTAAPTATTTAPTIAGPFNWSAFTLKGTHRHSLVNGGECRVLKPAQRGHIVLQDGVMSILREDCAASTSCPEITTMNGYARFHVGDRPVRVNATSISFAFGKRGQKVFLWEQPLLLDSKVLEFRSNADMGTSGVLLRRDIEFAWQLQMGEVDMVGSDGKARRFPQGDNHFLEMQIKQGGDVRMCLRINDLTV